MMKKITLAFAATLFACSSFAQHSVETNGTRHTIIFEGTGAWCGHCGDGAIYLKKALDGNPQAIGVAVHQGDGMSFTAGNTINSAFTKGYPSGYIDMHVFDGSTDAGLTRSLWASRASSRTSLPADMDVKLDYDFDKDTREITATVTVTALTDNLKEKDLSANVILTEDNVVGPNGSQYSQTNYTPYNTDPNHPHYNLGVKIDGFEHMHVLRAMFEGAWGKDLGKKLAKGESATLTTKYTVPAKFDVVTANLDKMHIIAYVQETSKAATKKNTKDAQVYNSIGAKFLAWSTSVGEISQVAEMRIYPNPASKFINVQAQLSTPAKATITISNMVGQTVFTKEYAKGSSMLADNISTVNFTGGIYMIKVSSNGEHTTQKLVIKN